MHKINCWEFMKCGREPGGLRADELGICSAALETSIDGINGGENGGRTCWAISGTFCEGKVQGSFANKIGDCKKCDFYKLVKREQEAGFQDTREIRRAYMLNHLACFFGEEAYKEVLNIR